MQHRDDALAVMDVRWRDSDRQRKAVLVDREMDLDALDLLAAVEAAPEAARRGPTGPAVDDDGAGVGRIAASLPPSQDQAVEQPAPQPEPGPASKQRVQRAERNSWPIARHCMPQKQTHQIAMIALRRAAPANGGFGPRRVGFVPAMAASSASTASTKASTSLKASHEAREVLAGVKAVPICCGSDGCCDGRRHSPSPSRASAPIHLKVASRKAPAGTPHLRTDSQIIMIAGCRRN